MNKDLTTGKPEKVLWQFCLPLFGSIIFQQLYNIADSFVAGKFISDNALAAVGNSYEITLIFIAFAFGCNIACSVLAALFFGAKQYKDLKTAVYTALISSCVICAALMLVGTLCCDSLLRLIKTPEEVFADSKLYLDIYIYGLPFVFLYNVATGIFSALGDSKTPFIFLACSSTSNIAVDLLVVTAFNLGVAGVAWATFIAQGASGILAFVLLLRRVRSFDTGHHFVLFAPEMLRRLTNYAVPSIAQQSFVSVGNVVIQYYINLCGATVIAGFSAANRVNQFALTCCMSFASGLSSYVAQNIGARKLDRIGPGLKWGAVYSLGLSVVFMAIYLPFANKIISLFVPAGSASGVIDVARGYLFTVVPFYLVVCTKFVCDSVLRGAGAMRPFMVTTFSDLIIRVVLSIALFYVVGNEHGIWLSWPIGWFLGSGLSVFFYKSGAWKKNLPTF